MEITMSVSEFVKLIVIGFAVSFGWHGAAYLWSLLQRRA